MIGEKEFALLWTITVINMVLICLAFACIWYLSTKI
jgi:hypothetical protein